MERSRKTQKELDFSNRGVQFRLLDRLGAIFNRRMVLTLRAISATSFGPNPKLVDMPTLAAQSVQSIPTVNRALRDLKTFRVIVVERPPGRAYTEGRQFSIMWGNVHALLNDPDARRRVEEWTGLPPANEGRSRKKERPPKTESHPSRNGKPSITEPEPIDHRNESHRSPRSMVPITVIDGSDHRDRCTVLHPKEPTYPCAEPAAGTAAVGEGLRKFGVQRSDEAVASARANGCTDEQIQAILEYAERMQPAYGAGAVYYRVCGAVPGQPVDAGWSAKSTEYLAQQAKAEAEVLEKAHQADRERHNERRRKSADDRRARAEREATFGSRLDALSTADFDSLCFRAGSPDAAAWMIRVGRKDSSTRDQLFRFLEKEIADGDSNGTEEKTNAGSHEDRT